MRIDEKPAVKSRVLGFGASTLVFHFSSGAGEIARKTFPKQDQVSRIHPCSQERLIALAVRRSNDGRPRKSSLNESNGLRLRVISTIAEDRDSYDSRNSNAQLGRTGADP